MITVVAGDNSLFIKDIPRAVGYLNPRFFKCLLVPICGMLPIRNRSWYSHIFRMQYAIFPFSKHIEHPLPGFRPSALSGARHRFGLCAKTRCRPLKGQSGRTTAGPTTSFLQTAHEKNATTSPFVSPAVAKYITGCLRQTHFPPLKPHLDGSISRAKKVNKQSRYSFRNWYVMFRGERIPHHSSVMWSLFTNSPNPQVPWPTHPSTY